MLEENQKLIFTWDEFWQYCQKVTEKIIQENQEYSQIISILRGGFYLGDYLSRRLNIPLSAIVAKSYSEQNQQGNLLLGQLSCIEPPTNRVLLVDDLLDTGVTMIAVKKALENQWQVKVDTAVIWQKSHSQCQADYFCEITPASVWIVQPFD
ncbi:phosphoribosyltransferase family protein [Cyanobacterium aponinum UTEX 3222]|uniref:Phosphoribosyltransferase n=1 Tax=Cyanobacterium aponinum (strain PCC 10605) TaxID=755178 RepID=K9Z7L1_CYAAP|nr:phosphoribosyltransferase family protein [Cyanobacterium aponinum]AFZ54383.1 phosphoribosyltransferase [Cyanobacterium aponinum PCC 10605]PHV62543.1 phosphoribosyltransferase [Cyanobacterium aponinum IPPAS B-1201]WRL37314.1 phosphoribosyltransferase family protein [Cyanobacterium aponinum UTEX 3221]WRL43672.1 phosphoribosyltransferase family protein [Cyanobacterium aponinum UTEX 3222]